MKFFKRKKKDINLNEEVQLGDDQYKTWPSLPTESLKSPSLKQVIKHGEFAPEAKAVFEWGKSEETEGAEVNYQVPMNSQFGAYTLPALVKRKDGGFLLLYSHCSEWDDTALSNLLEWVVKVRTSDFVHSLKIEICADPVTVPDKVLEIISKKKVHRMMISMVPLLRKDEVDVNARIFAEGFGHFFNENRILNFDNKSLMQVEEWYKKTVGTCLRESFYFRFYYTFIGAYLGRVAKEECGGEWLTGQFPLLELGEDVKIRFEPFRIIADFIFNPRLENSPSKNLELLKMEFERLN